MSESSPLDKGSAQGKACVETYLGVRDDGASHQAGGSIKGERLSYRASILKNFTDRQRIED